FATDLLQNPLVRAARACYGTCPARDRLMRPGRVLRRNVMAFATLKLPIILFGAAQLLKMAARRHPKFKARLKERNLVAKIMTRDEEIGRWYKIDNGVGTTGAGLHEKPDIELQFKNAKVGASLLMPPINWLDQINAQKDFNLTVEGPE